MEIITHNNRGGCTLMSGNGGMGHLSGHSRHWWYWIVFSWKLEEIMVNSYCPVSQNNLLYWRSSLFSPSNLLTQLLQILKVILPTPTPSLHQNLPASSQQIIKPNFTSPSIPVHKSDLQNSKSLSPSQPSSLSHSPSFCQFTPHFHFPQMSNLQSHSPLFRPP